VRKVACGVAIHRDRTRTDSRPGGIVWNCGTGVLARLGARVRTRCKQELRKARMQMPARVPLAAYKDFLTLSKDADARHPHSEAGKDKGDHSYTPNPYVDPQLW
jgi:hypothetical protein